jgi:hypothetical protein
VGLRTGLNTEARGKILCLCWKVRAVPIVTQIFKYVRFQVLTASSMKFRVFWQALPCGHIDVDRRFRDAYCLHRRDDE